MACVNWAWLDWFHGGVWPKELWCCVSGVVLWLLPGVRLVFRGCFGGIVVSVTGLKGHALMPIKL